MKKIIIKNRKGLDLHVLYDVAQSGCRGIVFIQHGLTGSKDERHIKRITEVFSISHYTTIVFDATNSIGESGSDREGITFTSHYNDLQDVIEWASKNDWYEEPFILTGHSLGGMSVIYYAENHPDKVKLLIPISPCISGETFRTSRKKRMGKDFDAWAKNGYYDKTSSLNRKTARVPFNLVNDMLKYDNYKLADKIKSKTIFINGNKDESTPLEDTKKFYNTLKCSKDLKIIKNCEHVMKTEDNLRDLESYLIGIIRADVRNNN